MEQKRIYCTTAAKIMGFTNMYLAVQLRNKNPNFSFGVAIPPRKKGGNWDYYIIPAKFAEFMGMSEEELWERVEEVSKNAV